MTLGENITRLRTEKGMSQGALAEALEVSRQSVSKWETDASVPELEKLIRLAKLFGVTLDELVTGEKAPGDPVQTPSTPEVVFVERKRETRKTVGAALLCTAFAVVLLFTLASGDPWAGGLFALPPLVCGLTCFLARRNALLWCLWVMGFLMDAYLRLATGVNWRLTLLTPHFTREMNYLRLAIAWVQLLYMLMLPLLMVGMLGGKPLEHREKARVRLLVGWVALGVLWLAVQAWALQSKRMYAVVLCLADWPMLLAAGALAVWTARYFRGKKGA